MKRILIFCIITVVIFILLFNLQIIFPDSDFRHSTLGEFGEFYGGVLGTILALAGLYFIYQTYSQQAEQLKIAKYDADFEIINKLYNDLLEEINSIQYRKTRNQDGHEIIQAELYQGIDALYNFDSSHWKNPNSVINQLNSIIISFDQLLMMTNKVKFKYDDLKEIMLTKTYFLFNSKILWPAVAIYSSREEFGLTNDNADSTIFFKGYKRLTIATIDYLTKKKLMNLPTNQQIASILQNNITG